MKYEISTNIDNQEVIVKTDLDGTVSMFFADESNADYKKYLEDIKAAK